MAANVRQLRSSVIPPGARGGPGSEAVPSDAGGSWFPGPDVRWEAEAALHARLVAAMEEERAHIARELHDVVGQALTAVRLSLLALDGPGGRTPAGASRISNSLAAVDDAIRQVRTASFNLRPSVLDDLGLGPALRALGREVAHRSGLAVSCRVAIGDVRLAPEVETTCFRVAQEAITNAVRHAGARRVVIRVVLRRRTGTLVLEVRDDGAGFDPSRCTGASGIGLRGMAQRSAIVGGSVEVRSAIGDGTTVIAHFPVGRVVGRVPRAAT
jgi:signal transduction histidine kinase